MQNSLLGRRTGIALRVFQTKPRRSRSSCLRFSAVLKSLPIAAALLPFFGHAMEIKWTRMAGQWPVECSPLVAKFDQTGNNEILVLNRGGQLLLWSPNGSAVGTGQDGLVAQLPEGRWTTTPTLLEPGEGARLIVANVEGLVVGLDQRFQLLWQHKLAGETGWENATPARLQTSSGPGFAFGDGAGTVTCFTSAGRVLWTNSLGVGPIKVPPQRIASSQGDEGLFVAAGSTLFRLNDAGQVRWRRDLGKEILTRPAILPLSGRNIILCGTASGSLFALSEEGDTLWQCPIGEVFNSRIAFVTRKDAAPLILCLGLWGNLHAIDAQGHRVWTHLFRAKNRAMPLVLDADGDGHSEIFVPTFGQHVYEFDENGALLDDVRLSGVMPSALVPINDSGSGRSDVLVTTCTLLAYRLRPGTPISPYGKTGEPKNVSLIPPSAEQVQDVPSLRVLNPNGALINVELSLTDSNGWPRIYNSLTARSAFEMPLPKLVRTGDWSLHATARDARGTLLDEKRWHIPPLQPVEPAPPAPGLFRAWATQPFGSFHETRLSPLSAEMESGQEQAISVKNLYQAEIGHGAFIIASTMPDALRARITLTNAVREDGKAFRGKIVLREVVETGSVNGELVPDALPKLDSAGLVTILPHRSKKIWLNVDAHGAEPGNYKSLITIAPLHNEAKKLELPLTIKVLNLRLPSQFPLTLCTWDYVPNHWFPTHTKAVLDDMSRHGVNVFPRTTIPPGRVDAAGKLTIDWPVLDAELDRLQGRGKILFHLNHPPIKFEANKTAEEKRPFELEYIRGFRDHLRDRGWGYADYAFYLLDEPGLYYGKNVHILLDAGKLFREADPKLQTYTDPVPALSWKDFERIEPLVDIWTPNMRLVSGLLSGDRRIQQIMKHKTVWSYECVGLVKSLSPLRYNRANAWRARFFGLSGIGFWTYDTTELDIWFAGKTFNDEYALVYPGEFPVPSVRWEAVRDGLQDVAAMHLLEAQIQQNRKAGTKAELVQQAEKTLRISLRDVMELSDEAFVESKDFLRAGDRILGHTWTDVEMYRRHRAEFARLTQALAAN
jgi:PQQ-like domain/Glycoside hydrolase 123, catalytic domain